MPGQPDMTTRKMTHFLHTQSDLAAAMAPPARGRSAPRAGAGQGRRTRDLRRGEAGFPGLARIICGQQLSTASARAIWGRLQAAFDPFHHDALRRARADQLGRLGLSAAKIKSIKAIAASIAKGELDLDAVGQQRCRRRACGADRDARHRAVDRRYLSAVLPRPCRCLAGRRPRLAGSGAHRASG